MFFALGFCGTGGACCEVGVELPPRENNAPSVPLLFFVGSTLVAERRGVAPALTGEAAGGTLVLIRTWLCGGMVVSSFIMSGSVLEGRFSEKNPEPRLPFFSFTSLCTLAVVEVMDDNRCSSEDVLVVSREEFCECPLAATADPGPGLPFNFANRPPFLPAAGV